MTRNHPDQPAVEEIVEEHRETFELVADGDDGAARMAQNILDEADN